jgi:hypothetical protein
MKPYLEAFLKICKCLNCVCILNEIINLAFINHHETFLNGK